jgi:serine/threonine protein phosphatase PrpC
MWSAHVGDSRMIIKHQDTITATQDHTPTNELELERIKRTGVQLYGGTRIRCGNRILAVSRAFGDAHFKPDPDSDIEKVRLEYPEYTCVVVIPTITHHVLSEGDTVVLVTDGVTNVMNNEEVIEATKASSSEDDVTAKAIVETALTKGTQDNVCVMVVKVSQ